MDRNDTAPVALIGLDATVEKPRRKSLVVSALAWRLAWSRFQLMSKIAVAEAGSSLILVALLRRGILKS